MNKEFIPYDLALELKQLGFDDKCFGYWNIDPQLKTPAFNMVRPFEHEWCLPAPLYQQAFRFFREKYQLTCWVYNSHMDRYYYTILQYGRLVKANSSLETYEEAEHACLLKLIELAKK